MKLNKIQEPLLQFGNGNAICPRIGITQYNVYDTLIPGRREKINVGAVGTSECLEKLGNWLKICSEPIAGVSSNIQLHPDFCGFNKENGFKAEFAYFDNLTRSLANSLRLAH